MLKVQRLDVNRLVKEGWTTVYPVLQYTSAMDWQWADWQGCLEIHWIFSIKKINQNHLQSLEIQVFIRRHRVRRHRATRSTGSQAPNFIMLLRGGYYEGYYRWYYYGNPLGRSKVSNVLLDKRLPQHEKNFLALEASLLLASATGLCYWRFVPWFW